MTKTLAQNIVEYRDENGRFESRAELKKVPRLGPKAFEQCAGFMRIADGEKIHLMLQVFTQKLILWSKKSCKPQLNLFKI